jgi:hypothetical protein
LWISGRGPSARSVKVSGLYFLKTHFDVVQARIENDKVICSVDAAAAIFPTLL